MAAALLESMLNDGLADLGITASREQVNRLLAYLELLTHWNTRFNLTAVRKPEEMVTRHLLDSLALLPHIHEKSIIDVGSGAGLPGIPLAIFLPDSVFTLLDSNGKKTRFMMQAKAQLGLHNVTVVKSRAEDYIPIKRFDAVLSRAFASLDDMITRCTHLLDVPGVFLAMKGQRPDEELAALAAANKTVELALLIDLVVPGLHEERCLLRLHKTHQ